MTNGDVRLLLDYIRAVISGTGVTSQRGALAIEWVVDNANLLGLEFGRNAEEELEGNRARVIRRKLRQSRELREAVTGALRARRNSLARARLRQFDHNLMAFADYLGLDEVEGSILGIVCRYHSGGTFENLVDHFLSEGVPGTLAIALMLGLKEAAVQERLGVNGALIETGLLAPNPRGMFGNHTIGYDVAKPVLRALNDANRSVSDISAILLGTPGTSLLKWEDFDHIAVHRDFLLRLVTGSCETGERGVNVLIYGPPGTGKTEFCKVLAARAGIPAYFTGEVDESGNEPSRSARLAGLRLSQNLLRHQGRSLLIFDEMEDLSDPFGLLPLMSKEQGGGMSKVFMNRLLENNAVPTFWLTNDIQRFDPAILRRIAYSFELPSPPRTVREQVWDRVLADQKVTLPREAIRRLTGIDAAPGLVASAVKAARIAGGRDDDILRCLKNMASAMNGGVEPLIEAPADGYVPELCSAAVEAGQFAQRLLDSGNLRFSLCLYGPPGTGKSAYVRWLAARLGLEVMHKRASDLLSMWVGESEKKIAAAFQEARRRKAFLIIDEADSLLRDRGGAQRSWEVTQVNEMLTWMESHDHPFACTTNLMESLDSASLRRFTFKIPFGYLGEAQSRLAFRRFFAQEPPAALARMETLTPGDFAVVKRKAELLGVAEADQLCQLLREECSLKTRFSRPVGFVH